jgi:hypothetical protein
VTALFTVWDRWVRDRPLAWPTIKTFGANSFKSIRIKNPGHGDVFVLGGRAYSAGIYGVANKDTSDAILQATVPRIYGVADLHVLLQQTQNTICQSSTFPRKWIRRRRICRRGAFAS